MPWTSHSYYGARGDLFRPVFPARGDLFGKVKRLGDKVMPTIRECGPCAHHLYGLYRKARK